jgi:hypothetical protein
MQVYATIDLTDAQAARLGQEPITADRWPYPLYSCCGREVWRDAPDLPDHLISSHGRLLRLAQPWRGQILRPQEKGDGALSYTVRQRGRLRALQAARLVARAWHGEPSTRQYAHPADGDLQHICAQNVGWTTRSAIVAAHHARKRAVA